MWRLLPSKLCKGAKQVSNSFSKCQVDFLCSLLLSGTYLPQAYQATGGGKRDLLEAKETYYRGKRDLLEAYQAAGGGKRDLLEAKETYYRGKRDLLEAYQAAGGGKRDLL
jgi:hypothetical protein